MEHHTVITILSTATNDETPSTTTISTMKLTRKQTRRGRMKNKNNIKKIDKFIILHTNAQSFTGRLCSLEAIANSVDIDLISSKQD